MLAEIATDAVDERKQKVKWQKVAGLAAGVVILLLATMFGLTLAANEMSQEARSVVYAADHAELTSSDGTRIRCASADIAMAADGTTMVRGSCPAGAEGGNCTQAARTSLTKTLVTLTDLPRQSMNFLENMDQVMYKQDGSVIMKKLV